MEIGIQSNLWGPEYHREKLPGMLAEMAQAGYTGIEIGAHRFENLNRPDEFRAQVEAAGLHVAGIHTLGKFYFDGNPDYPTRAAEFTQAVGARFMLVSGEPDNGHTLQDYQRMAEVLNQAGKICQARGLTYCYHNHWWEIENEQAELRTLLDLTDPALVSLCLDIGWVKRAGCDPVEITAQFKTRIRYFHLKDTRGDKFTDLGQGTLDFPAWRQSIQSQGPFYFTHERDEVLPNAFESARTSREYLRGIGL
ncbi:MAG: sugar phosphate isomerase/epimerase family protein [Chloroflexota bacterium]